MHTALVAPVDAGFAVDAAKLSAGLKLPMADSLILQTARAFNATLWTQNADF